MTYEKSTVDIWPKIPRNPLPPDLANLPTVVAVPWAKIGDGMVRPTTEGSVFDRDGNLYACYRVHPEGSDYTTTSIVKITPEKERSIIYAAEDSEIIGLAVHKDGRFFSVDIKGKMRVLAPDGSLERELFEQFPEKQFHPNDLAFDDKGNVYFSDFQGNISNPCGGIYRLDEAENYEKLHVVADGLCSPNGVAFSPDYRILWSAETTANTVLRLDLGPDGYLSKHFLNVQRVYKCTGHAVVDSNKVDSAGNVYQTMMYGGRMVILNPDGIPVGNVVIDESIRGDCMFSPNLAIRPNSSKGYLVSSGIAGSWACEFPTLAPAMALYSDM